MQFTAENTILKSMSFSFGSNYKKTSIKHNERKPEDRGKLKDFGKHIHWDKTSENEVLVSKPIKEVYRDVFQKSVDEYNSKQRRKDRKIKDFYSKMRKDKAYDVQKEFIVQVGKKGQQLSDDPKQNDKLQKAVLETYLEKFEDAYPQLHVYSAVVHVDEASPHLHLAVVPEATGYKRGVAKKPSFSKAMGITNQETFKAFCEANRDLLQQSVREVLGVDVKRETVGTHAYLPPEQYRELMAKADAKVQKAQDTLDDAEDKASDIVATAKAEAEKIASDAKTKAEANAEVMRYRTSEMSKVDREVEAEKEKKRSQVDREVVAYRKDKKSQVDNEVETYERNKKIQVDDRLKAYETGIKAEIDGEKLDADQKLAEATQKFTEALAKETELSTRERDLADRELMLKNKQEALTEKGQNLDDREEKLDRREKHLDRLENVLKAKIDAFNEHMTKTFRQLGKLTMDQLRRLHKTAKERETMQIKLEDLNQQNRDQQDQQL